MFEPVKRGKPQDRLTEKEQELRDKFEKSAANRVPSNATLKHSERLENLVLPPEERGKMPLTKEQYVIAENPHLIAWEREVRKFLVKLPPKHGHRVSAPMIYEWATGISVKKAMEARNEDGDPLTYVRADLRKINEILRYYFGKPYMTTIASRKVPNCYRIRPGYYIRRHRPKTMALWVEYTEGSLYP